MPRVIADLIGGNSLRLEQIPGALRQLQLAQILLETHGLGYDALRLYATPATRFSAICLAWCHLRDRDGNNQILSQLQTDYFTSLENPIMFENSGPLVRLGHAAAQIQRRPLGKSSANEEMLVFKLCMEAANAARAAGQGDEQSLIYAVAGELETNLVRKEQAAARRHREDKSLLEGCLEVAELFVRTIWNDVLKHRPPSQRNRRILGSIYRMAFLHAVRSQSETPVDKTSA